MVREQFIEAVVKKFGERLTRKKNEHMDSYYLDRIRKGRGVFWIDYQESGNKGYRIHLQKEDARKAGKRNLDVAQLLKHYLGLSRLLHDGKATSATLLYLFWEPVNAADFAICRQHRTEIEDLTKRVAGSVVAFKWMSYPELWDEWSMVPELVPHVQNLKVRYEVSL